MIEFHPLMNHVLLKIEPEPEQSDIIAVQRSVEGLHRFGEVLAIGPEVRDVKVGQRVWASITAAHELAEGHLIREDAIQGILHE